MSKREIDIRRIVIFGLIICVCIFSVAYAVLAENLSIVATGTIDAKWDISITDIYSGDVEGSASNAFEPKILSPTSASFAANLIAPNDALTYTVVIENKGTVDAYLKDIVVDETSNVENSNILYNILGVEKGETKLDAGTKNSIKIRVYYKDIQNSEKLITETKTFGFNFIYEQAKN